MSTILIIEDDPLMLKMYQKTFSLEKYNVDVAIDGEQALQKIRAAAPALILLDIMMPKLNGLQLLDQLKSDPSTKAIPVIMLTNLASENEARNALLKGATKYIIKSQHEPRAIVNMVKEILAPATPPAPS